MTLLHDEFTDLPIGQFSAEVGPHTEYHFLPEAAPKGNWTVACFISPIESQRAWHIVECEGAHAFSQTYTNERPHTHPVVVAGESEWRDYTTEVTLTPHSAHGRIGVLFRCHNSRCYYFFGLVEGGVALICVNDGSAYRTPVEHILAEADRGWELDQKVTLTVTLDGNDISCSIDGDAILNASDDTFPSGKVGFLADSPCDYHEIRVEASQEEHSRVNILRSKTDRELDELRDQNPKPVLWKKIATPGFGVGRNLRFGDLNGDGTPDVLVTQIHHHGPKDAYCECHCLTAMRFDGDILWRVGEPHPDKYALTNDVGVQIHDIDNDGRNEVIYCKDFEIIILDGATGEVKLRAPTPESHPPADQFPRILGDCLFFCDLSGNGHPQDILIKDRYWRFWILNDKLETQWEQELRTGHYPYACDIDGDGHDELAIGFALFDHDGSLLWNLEDQIQDHADFGDGQGLKILYTASDSGVFFTDLNGNILKHHWIGHGQNPAIARFREDQLDLQAVSINFWGNQGILHFYDSSGNIYHDCVPNPFGSMCLPINWKGDGIEYFVHNPNVTWGGMFDGWGRPVVSFPDDGHPDTCNAVLDITGDCRDEVVVWNPDEIWVYTQDDGPREGKLYNPIRNSLSNSSNYQASVSLPGWSE